MNLLIDVCIVMDVCAARSPHAEFSAMALQHCSNQGGTLWLYVGSLQTLKYTLYRELKRSVEPGVNPPGNRQLMQRAKDLLKAFAADKQWLAALAEEGPVFDSPDPEEEQLMRALGRFSPGDIQLLTRDELLCERYPDLTITPEQYLQQPPIPRPVDFIDLKAQQNLVRPGLELGIHRVLHHGRYIMGPEVGELEEKLAAFVGSKHCLSCSSGTDALLMALMALDIGPGDEVITVPYTWISTAEVIALLHAKPVFVDVRPDTFNMDPDRIEAAVTPRTRAIMPVGIYGQCADMTRINAIARKHNIPVIEDAAQSFGADHHGKKSCSLSTIGCTSFFPSKPLGCYGDGGAVFTDDDALADRMAQIRVHGQKVKHQHPLVGINGRLDTLQAAVLLEKLKLFPGECDLRWDVGQRYDRLLSGIAGITTPVIEPGNTTVYAQYTLLTADRGQAEDNLKTQGIPCVAYYAVPLHLQGAFRDLGHQPGDFPVAERVASYCLSLPMSPYLTDEDQEPVAQALRGG
ncbi:MAG: DegT/DnrJ/EryC1/StrS family aminotransferase [Deltaproteobacteria bacterium]|nr:DegT/DnrJ/EryC1/StrS family aminotransferase [Deltaproteobacteria bacterium]